MRLPSLLIVGLLLAPCASRAEDKVAARRLYESGTKHFDLAEYEAALEDFKEGYRQKDDPVFLYNIGQCYRLIGKNEDAVRFYRNYLRKLPQAKNRVEVEEKIATLEQALAAQEKARSAPRMDTLGLGDGTAAKSTNPAAAEPTPSPAPEPTPVASAVTSPSEPAASPTPIYKKWWLWTAVGAAVVVAGVGVGVGVGLSSGASETSFPAVMF